MPGELPELPDPRDYFALLHKLEDWNSKYPTMTFAPDARICYRDWLHQTVIARIEDKPSGEDAQNETLMFLFMVLFALEKRENPIQIGTVQRVLAMYEFIEMRTDLLSTMFLPILRMQFSLLNGEDSLENTGYEGYDDDKYN